MRLRKKIMGGFAVVRWLVNSTTEGTEMNKVLKISAFVFGITVAASANATDYRSGAAVFGHGDFSAMQHGSLCRRQSPA